jgi:hypothetical protein
MRNFKYIFVILIFASIYGCSGCGDNLKIIEEESDIIEYDNIMIYTDLSSRMDKNPNDTTIINQLIDFFITGCVKPGIKVNDRSAISFSRINYKRSSCPSANINIGQFKNIEQKQQFVNNISEDKNLKKSIIEFKNSISCNYQERDNGGLDLLSLIYQEINTGNNIKKPEYIISETDTTTLYYYNHLFIFTDGYLEYSTETGNTDFYFGEPQIEGLRKYCRKNKVAPEDAIRNNSQFKLRPLVSDNNKLVSLYILETDDRGFNVRNGTLKNTGDLSDNNLLRLVWKVWAEESGFRYFEWKPITTTTNLPTDFIQKIIKH